MARYATDQMRRKRASDLDTKIPDRHKLQFELLADGPITPTVLAEASGCLALKLPFADIADIGADHEAEQMLGIDTLGMDAGRQQRSKRHDRRLKSLCTRGYSHSAGHGVERVSPAASAEGIP